MPSQLLLYWKLLEMLSGIKNIHPEELLRKHIENSTIQDLYLESVYFSLYWLGDNSGNDPVRSSQLSIAMVIC